MTRAPRSASCIVQYGPDSTRVKSMTSQTVEWTHGERFMAVARVALTASNRDEIAEQRVGGLLEPAAQLTDRDLAEQSVCSTSALAMPRRPASRSRLGQFDQAHRGRDAAWRCLRGGDEADARGLSPCAAIASRAVAVSDAFTFDRLRRHARAHEHVGQRRRLCRRIPAVEVEGGIRFGDACLPASARRRRRNPRRPRCALRT